jgi:hypothetical protein
MASDDGTSGASPTVTVKVHPMVLDSEHWMERQKVQMKVCQMQKYFSAGDGGPPKVPCASDGAEDGTEDASEGKQRDG